MLFCPGQDNVLTYKRCLIFERLLCMNNGKLKIVIVAKQQDCLDHI